MKKLLVKTMENNIIQKLEKDDDIYFYTKGDITVESSSIEGAYNSIMKEVLYLLGNTPKFLKASIEYVARVKPELLSKRFTEQALHLLDIDEHGYIEAAKQAVYYTALALMKDADLVILSLLNEIEQLEICVENNLISTKEFKSFINLYKDGVNIDKSKAADESLGILINNYTFFREKEISEENIYKEIANILEKKYSVYNSKEIASYLVNIIASEENIDKENKITLLLTIKEILEEDEDYVKKILDKNCSKEIVKEE